MASYVKQEIIVILNYERASNKCLPLVFIEYISFKIIA